MTNIIILIPKNEFYNKLVDEIIKEMESSRIIWKEPWINSIPRNYKTKKKYHGLNILSLMHHAFVHGFKSSYWLTENQAISLGGRIREGEKKKYAHIYKVKTENVTRIDKDGKTKNCNNMACNLASQSL